MKKALYISALLVATTLSAVAITRLPFPIDELSENTEYVALQEQDRALAMKEDSVAMVMNHTREQFRIYADSLSGIGLTPTPEDFSLFSDRIIELEQEIFDIRTMRGDVIARINELEQEWVVAQMNAPVVDQEESVNMDGVDEEIEVLPLYRNLVENYCFVDNLSAEDYAELVAAQQEDAEMDALVVEYFNLYNRMNSVANSYRTTDSEAEAEALYAEFFTLKSEAEALAAKIDVSWNHILDTKYYAYGYVLESSRNFELLDSSSEEFADMRRECSREAGYYASDALMHFALGRPTLRSFEQSFAQTMNLTEAADSIATIQRDAPVIDYRLEPINLERRLFIDYQPIKIGRTNFYRESNPIPNLKVYERGTIYRILLGEFRNKQPMTLFKGVQPLYITRNEDGYYLYYTGGFATRREADDAQLFLKEKGFKAPEICRWQDGKMVNITAMENEDGEVVDIPISGHRYMIHVATDTLSDELSAIISTEAPRHSISKDANGFTIGMFDSRDEVELLVSQLAENTSAPIEIIEVELNE